MKQYRLCATGHRFWEDWSTGWYYEVAYIALLKRTGEGLCDGFAYTIEVRYDNA